MSNKEKKTIYTVSFVFADKKQFTCKAESLFECFERLVPKLLTTKHYFLAKANLIVKTGKYSAGIPFYPRNFQKFIHNTVYRQLLEKRMLTAIKHV